VNFLLKGAKITPKKKAAMMKKIDALFPPNSQGRGVSFPSFKVCIRKIDAHSMCVLGRLTHCSHLTAREEGYPFPHSRYASGSLTHI
jgi:hypothetical protein